MKYFSMFSGIGGFELGIENSQVKAECIGCSEIDEYAIQIYNKHFKGHKNYGNCTEIRWEEVEDFDILVGGFPCQAFSIAGKRGGFNDTRGTLFFEIAECLREKQPRFFVLENVKGLLSHDKGNTFLTILTTLDELGYDLQWQVLNSKNFGVPQNRERVFIIGHLRGTGRPEVFPIKGTNRKNNERSKRTLRVINAQTRNPNRPSLKYSSGGSGILCKNNEAYCLQTAGSGQFIEFNSMIRTFTPIECERLQGFPDEWTKGISDSKRIKCLGNAVTTTVITAIFNRIK